MLDGAKLEAASGGSRATPLSCRFKRLDKRRYRNCSSGGSVPTSLTADGPLNLLGTYFDLMKKTILSAW